MVKRFGLIIGIFLGVLFCSFSYSFLDLAQATGARLAWEPFRNEILLSDSNHRLAVDLDSGMALGDGTADLLVSGIDPSKGTLSDESYRQLLDWWKGAASPQSKASGSIQTPPVTAGTGPRIQVIVLDAGHGGVDPGSLGHHVIKGKRVTLREKDLTLAVVLDLEQELKKKFPDRTIVLTRRTDTYPTLQDRAALADSQPLGPHQSILFLSVHFNASLNPKARGFEFWYVPQDYDREVISSGDIPDSVFPVLNTLVDSEYKKESLALAQNLAHGVSEELGDSNVLRGIKENPWFVVRMARMPAVLAEMGFITNHDEAVLLLEPPYLKKFAHGLYTGLVDFIHHYEDHS